MALPEVTTQNKTDKTTAINTAVAALVTKVDEALATAKASVPADLAIYTDATAQAVTDAMALPETNNTEKADKTTAINTAVAALVTKAAAAETAAIAAINAGGATLQNYTDAGITDVTAGNLADVNTAVATAKATKGSDLTKAEIQTAVDGVVAAEEPTFTGAVWDNITSLLTLN